MGYQTTTDTSLSSGSSSRSTASASTNTTLILPLLPAVYPDPTSLTPTIYETVTSLSDTTTSFHVLFSTPASHGSQLYPSLRQNPVANWADLQIFLGKIYACLAAAQWTSGRVLLEVEVGFVDEYDAPPPASGQGGEVIVLKGYEDLSIGSTRRPIQSTRTIPCPSFPDTPRTFPSYSASSSRPPVVALGGTFDHLHAAHKLLLHLALFLAGTKLIVGVMSDSLLSSKVHAPLVQPLTERIGEIEAFLSRHGARRRHTGSRQRRRDGDGDGDERVEMDVVEIMDPYGPTSRNPDIHALVVSQETLAGGNSVNSKRRENGLPELELFVINVIASRLEDGVAAAAAGQQPSRPGTPVGPVDEEAERHGRISVRVGDGELRTLDLTGETDEKKLKELKMGSTAIRQWIADRKSQGGG